MTSVDIGNAVTIIVVVLFYALLFRRFAANYISRKIKKQATLVDKYATRYIPVKKYPPFGARMQYVLTFICDQRTLKFEVSPWVYDTVKKNDKGVLIYQGTRFISFKD